MKKEHLDNLRRLVETWRYNSSYYGAVSAALVRQCADGLAKELDKIDPKHRKFHEVWHGGKGRD